MRTFLSRLAVIVVVALSPMAITTVTSPAVGWADCGDRAWDPVTKLCVPPPPVPEWYQPAPTWAQPWAPPWAPLPPPAPESPIPLKPVWDPRYNAWTFVPQ